MAGFMGGIVVAVLLIELVPLVASRPPKLWFKIVDISLIFFPTYVFLLPLSESASMREELISCGMAVVGNGVIYAAVAELGMRLYLGARRLLL